KTLPRISETVLPQAFSEIARHSPDHPANQPIDDLVESMCEGWEAINRGALEVTESSRPKTTGEAGDYLRASVDAYLDLRAKQASAAAAEVKTAAKPAAKIHAVAKNKADEPQRYLLLPTEGMRAQDSSGMPRTKHLLQSLANMVGPRMHALKNVVDTAPSGPTMQVLDSIHEDGAKLVSMTHDAALAFRSYQPNLRLVPEIFYYPALAPRYQAIRNTSVRPLAARPRVGARGGVTVQVTSRVGGSAVRGANVVAFTNFATRAGDGGITDSQGQVTL